MNFDELTPVERHGDVWVKRDDLFEAAGVRGGKVRTCWHLAQGAKGLVTAGSRASPQVNIVAHIARELGIPCRVHVPSGELAPEVAAAANVGAEVVQHRPGYNTVIVKRAREDAWGLGWTEIPFGMECQAAIEMTRKQAANIPYEGVNRVVVPVGSGMSFAGILWGMIDELIPHLTLGVRVGANPVKRLDRYAPPFWRVQADLIETGVDYHQPAKTANLGDLRLDSIYEAKCLPFLEPNDLLWVVGIRQTEVGHER